MDHAKVSSIRYTQPTLGAEYSELLVDKVFIPIVSPKSPLYRDIHETFDVEKFMYPKPPIELGYCSNWLYESIPNVLRMPLKYPGTSYRIPNELKELTDVITRIALYERAINDKHDDMFCHITYDRSTVGSGEYHRFPGFHGDGIQGTKLTPKIVVEHSYVIVTDPPTIYCLQPFFLKHLDESKHSYFEEFDAQADVANLYHGLNSHLYLIDPYIVHKTPKILQSTTRTFMRITYAHSELEHPKNTVNPAFAGLIYE